MSDQPTPSTPTTEQGTQVTCRDVQTGQTGSKTIRDDYLLVTDGRCYLDGIQRHANGTTVLTIKTRPGSSS